MKLAEALTRRAEMHKRLERLKRRILRNASVREGGRPTEDPEALLRHFEDLAAELGVLMQRIHRTNAGARLDGERTLTDVLVERDLLRERYAFYRKLAEETTEDVGLFGRGPAMGREAVIDVSRIEARADAISRELHALDANIQRLDWEIELSE